MNISFNNSTSYHNSKIKSLTLKNELRTKSQLNKIIVNASNRPDYLAINIYWDTFRSWYNPNKRYTQNGSILKSIKLKTQGIYTNYQKLSDSHGFSKETIRKKIAKLEKLGLISRSFYHKEKSSMKSFNRLVIYVWKDTPYFFNSCGIDSDKVTNLVPQTNHKYIAQKHNIIFNSQTLRTNDNQTSWGIQADLDTKELTKTFSKEKDISIESRSSKKLFEREKDRLEKKKFNQLKNGEPPKKKENKNKSLKLEDFYPLDEKDCSELQSSSGREFNLNSMNEILLDMSKKLRDRYFKSRKVFIKYMGKAFFYEKREAIGINNKNFRIKNNQSEKEKEAIQQEKYLTQVEINSGESLQWNFRRRLARSLSRKTAYFLLTSCECVEVNKNVFNVKLSKCVELTNFEKKLILNQARYAQEESSARDSRFTDKSKLMIDTLQIIELKKTGSEKKKKLNHSKKEGHQSVIGVWGRTKQKLTTIYGEATCHNWFSKLEAFEDKEKHELRLKASSNFIREWIKDNFLETIQDVVGEEKYEVVFN